MRPIFSKTSGAPIRTGTRSEDTLQLQPVWIELMESLGIEIEIIILTFLSSFAQ